MKVLIADPDWRFAQQARKYLEDHAQLVVHQGHLPEAVALADHWHPDLILLAAEFVEDGVLKLLNRLQPRPAVLLTEHMDRYDRAWRAWQQAGDELLMKPVFNKLELHVAVVTALENAVAGTRTRPAAAASA